MVIFHSYVNVYQRVARTKTMFFGGFNSEKIYRFNWFNLFNIGCTIKYGELSRKYGEVMTYPSRYLGIKMVVHSPLWGFNWELCSLTITEGLIHTVPWVPPNWFQELPGQHQFWVPTEVCSASWSSKDGFTERLIFLFFKKDTAYHVGRLWGRCLFCEGTYCLKSVRISTFQWVLKGIMEVSNQFP